MCIDVADDVAYVLTCRHVGHRWCTTWCIGGAHVACVNEVLSVLSALNELINLNDIYLIYTPYFSLIFSLQD